ncbi:hypothetical protein [Sphingomonas sp. BAUL-RG-20F-R05-02]|uniref:hypothetical protein n=1 Tax=Sphingomonas sp. BAUL-RG-20F-R05-02 TaxID=2914830 RepID=UPI001F59D794|nr:hypothetical protein [Sphingomonas sp. BAUL-RG-20F-R05-02]
MDDLIDALKLLARRYNSRWQSIDDALKRIRASDGAFKTGKGEQTRRLLANAFRVQSYPSATRERLTTDRNNALRKLGAPLAEALGHIITLELTEQMLTELDRAEKERSIEDDLAKADEESASVYGPLIAELKNHGVSRGSYSTLRAAEIAAIAKYINRKTEQRLVELPPIRTDKETRGPDGRRHPFWNPYHLPKR